MATPISQVANGFSDPLLYEPGIVPVVNLFIKSYWRLAALARLSLPYFGISFGPLLIFIEVLIRLGIYAARLYGFQILNPGETYILKHMTLRVTTAAMRKWPYVFTTIWWLLYQLFADVGDFELDYIGAWRHKLEQSSNSSPVEVHLYVENNYLKAPIPTRLDDAATLRALQMWYCLLQSKMGTGEILLPKRLIRIDRVRIFKAELRPIGLGSKIEPLVLGRSKNSHIAFFKDPEKVKGQVTVTQTLIANAEGEGLEFVRSWNIVAISAIVLLPFVLSLVFSGVWIGVFVKRGTDVQVVVQTAFTGASYIVTTGALLIALIAFIDSQASKGI